MRTVSTSVEHHPPSSRTRSPHPCEGDRNAARFRQRDVTRHHRRRRHHKLVEVHPFPMATDGTPGAFQHCKRQTRTTRGPEVLPIIIAMMLGHGRRNAFERDLLVSGARGKKAQREGRPRVRGDLECGRSGGRFRDGDLENWNGLRTCGAAGLQAPGRGGLACRALRACRFGYASQK